MSFFSIIRSGARIALVTPALWVYGIVAAGIGAALLISALLAAFPQYDVPVGHGLLGWLGLGVVMGLSFTLEAAACRAVARKSGLGGLASDTGKLLPRGFMLMPALVGLSILFCLIVAVPIFTFLRSFAAAILALAFPLAVSITIIVGSAAAALALVVPAWMMLPLTVRSIGVHDRDVADGLGDAMTVIGERTGVTFFCGLLCLALDAALLIAGAKLAARDLSFTGHFHFVQAWNGTHVAAGAALLALAAVLAALKAGIWTAMYLDVAGQLKWTDTTRPVVVYGDLMRLGILARRAARNLSRSIVPFILAAFIVFLGIPSTVDLLTVYHLVPTPTDDSAARILQQMPGGNAMGIYLFFPGLLLSLFCSVALVAGTQPLFHKQPASLPAALGLALRRIFKVIGAYGMMISVVFIAGAVVLVGVYFAMALVVQYAKGLNELADHFGILVATGVVGTAVLLAPFVCRAAVFENLKPSDAFGRGCDVAGARPRLVLVTFLACISLEVLRHPIARWAGLIPSGWGDMYALTGRVHPPVAGAKLVCSTIALLLSVVSVAFQAQLWTEMYHYASTLVDKSEPPAPAGDDRMSESGKKRRKKRDKLSPAHEPAKSP